MNKLIFGIFFTLLAFFLFTIPTFAAEPTWDTTGQWIFDYHYTGGANLHDMTLSQDENGGLSGSGGAFSGSIPYQFPWVIDNGIVDGDTITFTAYYLASVTCSFTATGIINLDGSMSGDWNDNCDGIRSGTWSTVSGSATRISEEADDKNDCKKDGWKKFNHHVFKNQGQCVSYLTKHSHKEKD